MEYRVEDLAAAAGVRVDTIRFYQSRGLLPKPRRQGRVALYAKSHLERLQRIRSLSAQGFSLAQIGRVLKDGSSADGSEPLLEALVEKEVGEQTYSRAELAHEAGVPEALVQAGLAAGLGQPIEVDGESRFTESDLQMARSALTILGAGFPLDALLELAVRHSQHVAEVADAAIDLFDDHVRKAASMDAVQDSGDGLSSQESVAQAFRVLLPQVTRLVALHFERTLVGRAIERLAESESEKEGRGDLERALAATRSGRLEVEWR